jgi:Natural resistance-associated macrophage protein
MAIVAVFGTTISPYLFLWQAGQEVEETKEGAGARPLIRAPEQAKGEFMRIRLDTYIGMGVSNLVALFIVITTAATLHAKGVTEIQTSAQAAEALRGVAGPLTFAVFAAGIIGTGMLALPALAGSAAYALGETSPIDPIKALYWSAVLNGVVAVPVMVTMDVPDNAPVGHGGVHAATGVTDHGLAGHRNNDSHGRRDDLVVAAMIKAGAVAILLAAVWATMPAAADEPSGGAPAPPPPSADPRKLLLGDIGGLDRRLREPRPAETRRVRQHHGFSIQEGEIQRDFADQTHDLFGRCGEVGQPSTGRSSLLTRRWREPDSNHRSRVRKSGRCQVPAIRLGSVEH